MARIKKKKQTKSLKPKRKLWAYLRFPFYITCLVAIVLFVTSGIFDYYTNQISSKFYRFTINQGFIIKNIYLKGNEKITLDQIKEKTEIKYGMPIFQFKLGSATKKIQELSLIDQVEVSRLLPNTIQITIIEKKPIALWQYQKQLQLVDLKGDIIPTEKLAEYRRLPIIIGEEARLHLAALYQLLNTHPKLWQNLKSATRVRERRWDLVYQDKLKVKLPEKSVENAIEMLAKLDREGKLFDNNIEYIDLRVENRIYSKYKNLN